MACGNIAVATSADLMSVKERNDMRTKGSCRFEPYFKVEVWKAHLVCWTPIQRAHRTEAEAIEAAPCGRFRIIEVSESGIKPHEPQEK